MDRLLCGDVGYGKTEVAMRAAFKALSDNKQVAVLAPTTVLAFQHLRNFQAALRAVSRHGRNDQPLPDAEAARKFCRKSKRAKSTS
jgi:primosomal protein N'